VEEKSKSGKGRGKGGRGVIEGDRSEGGDASAALLETSMRLGRRALAAVLLCQSRRFHRAGPARPSPIRRSPRGVSIRGRALVSLKGGRPQLRRRPPRSDLGYGVGLALTRRDLQIPSAGQSSARGDRQAFDGLGTRGPLRPASEIGIRARAYHAASATARSRQDGDPHADDRNVPGSSRNARMSRCTGRPQS